jgi:hypothetical protein
MNNHYEIYLHSSKASLIAAANVGFEKWQAWGVALSYVVEKSDVTTGDKYVLSMIHITPKLDNGSNPILLMHGNVTSADSFVDAFAMNP